MPKFLKVLLFVIIFLVLFSFGMAEEEISLSDIIISPNFYIISPELNKSYESGGHIKIVTKGENISVYDIILDMGDNIIEKTYNGESCELSIDFDPTYKPIELRIKAFANEDKTGPFFEQSRIIISPKQEIINRMIDLAYKNYKDKNYYFAPAEEDHHIGVCKNFVMRLFDTFSKEYRMAEFPDLKLHMPKNNSLVACKPYQYGIEWRIEAATDGSPFEIAAQFKYNNDISEAENFKNAHDIMTHIQKGDFLQIVGNYGGGNGPHSMYVIENYNKLNDTIHWTDSNMFGKRINGVRWGYMQFNATNTGEWFAKCFNTKNRGATIYRLRDDMIKP